MTSSAKRTGWSLTACAVLMMGSACSSQPEVGGPAVEPVASGLSFSFIQQRYEEGTPSANLRVVNSGTAAVVVSGLGIDWSGYSDLRSSYDTIIGAGQTLDLRLRMPSPRCPEGGDVSAGVPSDSPLGVLETQRGTVVLELDESGVGFLQRMWTRACEEQSVSQAVEFSYGGPWTLSRDGFSSVLRGQLQLTRVAGNERIEVTAVQGSVLLSLDLPTPAILKPGQQSVAVPLVMGPQRCDGHGVSQSSQTFLFRPIIAIGPNRPVQVIAEADRATRARATELVDVACQGADRGL